MPKYTYRCSYCHYDFDITHSIKQDLLTMCPECKHNTLNVIIGSPEMFMGTPKTIGGLAERNHDKMGNYERENAINNLTHKPKQTKKPWWRNTDKPNLDLAKLNKQQLNRYIREGKLH